MSQPIALDQPYFFFTVDAEEWFASRLIPTNEEERRAPSDFEEPMNFLLTLLKTFNIRATFFYVYRTARKYPQIVRRCIDLGHEIALHGEDHDNILDLGEQEFSLMLERMQEKFENEFSVRLKGYRAPHFGISPALIPLLQKSHFLYDSSSVPSVPIPGWYGNLDSPCTAYQQPNGIWEFPIAVHPLLRLPGAGGYYFRNIGRRWTSNILLKNLQKNNYATFYIHPWELSNHNPTHRTGVPFYTFRRTGTWARQQLTTLLQKLFAVPSLQSIPFGEFIP